MRMYRQRWHLAGPAQVQNPAWPWILGGAAVLAAGGTAYALKCQPKVVTEDDIVLPQGTLRRRIYFKGCFEELPYEVTITGPDFHISESFKTLEEARRYETEDDEDREDNPRRSTAPRRPRGGAETMCHQACSYHGVGIKFHRCYQECMAGTLTRGAPKPGGRGSLLQRILTGKIRARRRVPRGWCGPGEHLCLKKAPGKGKSNFCCCNKAGECVGGKIVLA